MSHADISRMSVSVVIPVFNAAPNLAELYRQLMPALAALVERFEVILVEDCSRDGSWDVVRRLAPEDERVRGIRLSRNFGQHNALLCGIRAARCDIIVTLDDDLQHPVERNPPAARSARRGPRRRLWHARTSREHGICGATSPRGSPKSLSSAMGAESAAQVSAFRAFPHAAARRIRGLPQPVRFDRRAADLGHAALLRRPGQARAAARGRVELHDAQAGRARVQPDDRLQHDAAASWPAWSDFSSPCSALASSPRWSGATSSAVPSVPGFAFLASIIAIFSGAQLFTLGIFGEYLGRMYVRTMERPAYVVGERCEQTVEPDEARRGRHAVSFAYTARSIRTAALQLDYFLVPWDSEILGVPVAQISELRVTDPLAAARDYEEFARWCAREGIALC